MFVDKLIQHGGPAYDHLCGSLLVDRTLMHILTMLNKEYENRRNNCIALLRTVNRATELDIAVDPATLPAPPPPTNEGSEKEDPRSPLPINGSHEKGDLLEKSSSFV